MALTVSSQDTVLCPGRGEIPVCCCVDCPLLRRIKTRFGHTQIVCGVPTRADRRLSQLGFH